MCATIASLSVSVFSVRTNGEPVAPLKMHCNDYSCEKPHILITFAQCLQNSHIGPVDGQLKVHLMLQTHNLCGEQYDQVIADQ